MKGRLKSKLDTLLKAKPKQVAVENQKKKSKTKVQAKQTQPTTQRIPYKENDRILLLGEGNFSFALALSTLFPTTYLVASAYDSRETVREKYPESVEILAQLERRAKVLFVVDATQLQTVKPITQIQGWSKIVFMFPHVGLGIKDQQRNIAANQTLVAGFFAASRTIANSHTEVHVTLRMGSPYDQWDIKKLAKQAGWVTATSFAFEPDCYPGYQHRRTLGYVEGVSKDENQEIRGRSRTYVFITEERSAELALLKEMKTRNNKKRAAREGTKQHEKHKQHQRKKVIA